MPYLHEPNDNIMNKLYVCFMLSGVYPEGATRGNALPPAHIKEDPGPSLNLVREVTPLLIGL